MARKLAWFKHYNTASEGNSLEVLWAAQDFEAIAFYWRLLEFVSLYEDENSRGEITLSYLFFKRKLGWNFQRTSRVLLKIAQSFQVRFEPIIEGETFKVFIPNWLDLQENRGGKRIAKKEQKPGRGERREVRIKKEELEIEQTASNFLQEKTIPPDQLRSNIGDRLLEKINPDFLETLMKAYPAEVIRREAERAQLWLESSGSRKKNYGAFLNNWLARDFKNNNSQSHNSKNEIDLAEALKSAPVFGAKEGSWQAPI